MLETVVALRGTIYENGYGLIAQKAVRDKNLSLAAKAIYSYLCSFAGSGDVRVAFPGVALMMSELGIKSKDTFYKYRRELERAGYIIVEQKSDDRGRFTRCIYYIEAVVTPKQPYPKNQDTETLPCPKFRDTENQDTINNSFKNINKSIECMNEAAVETAAAGENVSSLDTEADPIYEALIEHVPTMCHMDGMPLGVDYINAIYAMLITQFKNRLSPEVVHLACKRYFSQAVEGYDMQTHTTIMRLKINNPVGFFKSCYQDAVKIYKAQTQHSINRALSKRAAK